MANDVIITPASGRIQFIKDTGQALLPYNIDLSSGSGLIIDSAFTSSIGIKAPNIADLSGSNTFLGSNTFNGATTINGNLSVFGATNIFSASNIYITSSNLTVTDNILLMNALTPYQRYAGIQMYDSGSGTLSNLLWDGQGDYFFLSGSGINSKIIGGPDGQGNLSSGYIPKTTGVNILGDSTIYDTGAGIGISTTSPSAKLEVFGGSLSTVSGSSSIIASFLTTNSNSSYLRIIESRFATGTGWDTARTRIQKTTDVTDQAYIEFNPSGSQYGLAFGTGIASEKVRIDSSGNVGIGVASPITKLDVRSGYITAGTGTSTSGTTIIGGYYGDGNLTILGTEYSSGGPMLGYGVTPSTSSAGAFFSSTGQNVYRSAYIQNGLTHQWYTGTVQTVAIGSAVTISEKMRLTNAGNLGIGTTNPLTSLVVSNGSSENIEFSPGNVTYNGGIIEYINRNSVTTRPDFSFFLSSAGGGAFKFYTGGANERLRITATGNVGIGTTSPTSKLTVATTVATSSVFSVQGTNGTLFNVIDDLSDSLLSVNNSAGLPVLEVFADDRLVAGQYNQNDFVVVNNKVGIGTNNPSAKLTVTSSVSIPSAVFLGGNLGIGTTSPDGKLSIIQSNTYSTFRSNAVGAYTFLSLGRTSSDFEVGVSGGTDQFFTGTVAGDSILKTINGKLHLGYGSAAPSITINSSNNVGIGTSSPVGKLDIRPDASYPQAEAFIVDTDGSQNPRIRLYRPDGASPSSSYAIHIRNDSGNLNILTSAATTLGSETATSKFYFTTDGNLGIGTTSPNAKLVIDTGEPRFRLNIFGTNHIILNHDGSTAVLRTESNTPFTFGTNGTEKMRIAAGGNIGIGTTSPSALLHVSGSAATTVVALFQGYVGIGTTSVNFPLQVRRPGGAGSLAINVDNYLGASTRDVLLKVNPDTVGDTGGFLFRSYNGADVNAMAILATGNIGIGTTSPAAKLDVSGSLNINDGNINIVRSNANPILSLRASSSNTYSPEIFLGEDIASGGSIAYSASGNYFSINTGTGGVGALNTRMVFPRDSANVGIGTTSPNYLLDLYDTGANSAMMSLRSSGSGNAIIYLDAANGDLIGSDYCYMGQEDATLNFVINTGGNAGNIHLQPKSGTSNGILFVSGSTRFGLVSTHAHQFTGSVNISGSLNATASWANNSVTASRANSLDPSNSYTVNGLTANYVEVTGLATIPTTGIYRPATKTLGLSADGVLVFKISNLASPATSSIETGNFIVQSGNVGIATTNPATRLDVVGQNAGLPATSGATQSTSSILRLRNGNSNLVLDIGGYGGNGNWFQSTNRTDLSLNYPLLLNPNGGNVGIGIEYPDTKLDVAGAVTMPVIKQSTTLYAGTDITDDNSTRTVYFNILAGGYNPSKYFKIARIKITANYQNVSLNGYFTATNSTGLHVGFERKVEFDFIAYAATNPGAPQVTYLKRGPDTTTVLVYAVPNGDGPGTTYYDVYLRSGWYNDTNGELAIRVGYSSAVTVWQSGLDSGTSAPTDTLVNPNSNYSFDTTGNVGIGTTSPGATLNVSGSTRVSAGELQIEGNNAALRLYRTSGINYFDWASGQNLYLGTVTSIGGAGRSNKVVIQDDGNVGIGITSPVSPLHIFNTAATLATFTRDLATDVGFSIGADSNGTVLSTIGAHSIQIYTNSTEKVRINSDGNVGIGTSSPRAYLHVNTITGSAQTEYAGFVVSATVSSSRGVNIAYDVANDVGAIAAVHNGVAWKNLTLQPVGGNVGITTSSPLFNLSVNSTFNAGGPFVISGPANSSTYYDQNAGAYYHTPGAMIRVDSAASSSAHAPATLVLYNKNGTDNTSTKLVFANNETTATNANPVATAAITSEKVSGVANNWARGNLKFLVKSGSLYTDAAIIDANGNFGVGVLSNLQPIGVGSTSATTLGLLRTGVQAIGGNIGPSINFYLSQTSGSTSLTGDVNFGRITVNPIDNWGGRMLFFTKAADGNNLTAPTEKMRISEQGYVGIGTGSFVYGAANRGLLEIYGSTDSLIGLKNSTANAYIQKTGNDFYLNNGGAGTIYIQNNGNNRLVVDSNGNVGMGTTIPSQLVEAYKSSNSDIVYQVTNPNSGTNATAQFFASNGTTRSQFFHTGTSYTGIGVTNYTGLGGIYNVSTGISLAAGGASGIILFGTGTSQSERMRITNTGDVGIGTTSPTSRLTVATTVATSSVFSVKGTNGTLFNVIDDLSDSLLSVNNSAGLPVLEVFADDRLVAGQYNQNDFVVVNNKVGIGTNNPAVKLQVVGSSILANGTTINPDSYAGIVAGNVADGSGWGALGIAGNPGSTGRSFAMGVSGTTFYMGFQNGSTASSMQTFLQISGSRNLSLVPTSGNVGIGTTIPGAKLVVIGETQISSGANYTTHFYLGDDNFITTGNNGRTYFRGSSNGIYAMFVSGSGYVQTNYTTVLASTSGSVGIGNTTPGQKLSVQGEISKYTVTGVDSTFDNFIKYGYFGDLQSGATNTNRWIGFDASITAGGAVSNVLRARAFGGGNNNNAPVNIVDFRGDQTTYFYGNVGIGSSSPTVKLAVSDGTTVAQINPSSNVAYFGTVNNYPIAFSVNSQEVVRIDTSGNLGIGTTVPTNFLNSNTTYVRPSGSGEFLTVYSSTSEAVINLITSGSADGFPVGGMYFTRQRGQGDAHYQIAAIKALQDGTSTTLAGGKLYFYTKVDGAGTPFENPALVIKSNSYVGIGTTAPSEVLDVRGNIKLGATNSGSFIYYLKDNEGTIVKTQRSDTTQEGLFRSDGWGNFTFNKSIGVGYSIGAGPITGNIYASGNVGIGTNTSSAKLSVNSSGSLAAGSVVFRVEGTSGSLFSVDDTLSGSLMSVNDISGLPILEVFSDNKVVMGTFNANTLVVTGSRVGIGSASPTQLLDVNGDAKITRLGISIAPSNRLHVNGDGTNPAIRIDNGALVTGVASNSKNTFQGYLPVAFGTSTYYIRLWT